MFCFVIFLTRILFRKLTFWLTLVFSTDDMYPKPLFKQHRWIFFIHVLSYNYFYLFLGKLKKLLNVSLNIMSATSKHMTLNKEKIMSAVWQASMKHPVFMISALELPIVGLAFEFQGMLLKRARVTWKIGDHLPTVTLTAFQRYLWGQCA